MGASDTPPPVWPGAVLLVDDDESVLAACRWQLEQSGYACRTTNSYAEALDTLEQQADVGVVVLDHGLPGGNLAGFVEALRAHHRRIVPVGMSGTPCAHEFAAAGVDRFLQKPWYPDQLVAMVLRIGSCTECGLELPLRRPRPEEGAASWICALCGARYRGVLVASAPAHVRRNVRPVELGAD